MEDTLINPRTARGLTGGISESTQSRLVARGEYPAPVVLSRDRHGRPARIAFVRSELLEWCRAKIEATRGGDAST